MHRNKLKARSAFDIFLLVSAGILVTGFISALVVFGNKSLGNLSKSSTSSAAPVYSFAADPGNTAYSMYITGIKPL